MDAFVHRTGRTGRAGKLGRNIVMHNCHGSTKPIGFFSELEKSLKCSFKYSNCVRENEEAKQMALQKQLTRLQRLQEEMHKNTR